MKYVLSVAFLLFAFFLPAQAFAQVPAAASPSAGRASLPQLLKNTGPSLTQRTEVLTQKAAFKAAQEQVRTQLGAERQAFKVQLSTIKDQRKQLLVSNVNDRIASVSAEKTATMHQALTAMAAILTTITNQAAADKQTGDDTTAVDQAISTADQAITAADASVTAQASKTYPLTITGDTTLRQTVGATVITFRTDITGVYQQVVDARLAVMKAAEALSMLGTTNTNSTASGVMNP